MAKKNSVASMMVDAMEPAIISFNFPKGGGGLKIPNDFKNLTIDKDVTVVVKGKVCEICGEKEYGSPGFRVKPTSVEIEGKVRPIR